MPPGGPGGGPHGGGGPRGGRGPLSGGSRGFGSGPGGRSYGSMMRPPGGYWGENSGPLSPDRPHSSGYNPNINPDEAPSDELLSTKLGRNIYRAQVDAHRKSLKKQGVVLERGTPIQGKDIRLGSRIKGFFVGIGRTLAEPFSSLRSVFSTEIANLEFGEKAISKREYDRRMYNLEERKVYKSFRRGQISEEEYITTCEELRERIMGTTHTTGGPTR